MQIDLNISPQKIEQLLLVTKPGEEVLFTYGDKVIAQLNMVQAGVKKKRQAGRLVGQGIKLDERFFEPLDEEELKLW
ncbi:type II toxin-antitoxin system prevent-host-death family antitoxin [Glaesserella parasuis]|uniref:Uncharacterized protein n=1 Tax=Glaesserella parasuis TaxID=738 RepID=A0A0A0QCS2_GLAPU|nr:hypothetical protein [Glaesserella parasuis]AIJ02291.1 hypothetical protein [Glaesserella parasuis]ATW42966.1 hypothetical protein A2U20_03765 [Glaesserella parasuis D74]EQA10640.1 hypothetical protein HPSD74_0340 [Glaesserella parasuis D74]EQA11294.1 hypothetical protein HPS8415995_0013 [Glaesserella parasuis 84-15995]MCT8691223.1 hypothetical protein [Glaesserella parasuis]